MNFAMLILMEHIGALNAFTSKTEVSYRVSITLCWLIGRAFSITYVLLSFNSPLEHFSNLRRRSGNAVIVAVIWMHSKKSLRPAPKKTTGSRSGDPDGIPSGKSTRMTSTCLTTKRFCPSCRKRWSRRSRRTRQPRKRQPKRRSEKFSKIRPSLKREPLSLKRRWINLNRDQTTLSS